MEQKLTKIEAYNAMRKFLEGYYERTNSDDVGSLLGDMQFLPDDTTADPAAWRDWLESVDYALQHPEKDYLFPKE